MIEIEGVVEPSPDQMMFVIEGMRNPMNSWDKIDSVVEYSRCELIDYEIGPNDKNLMKRLAKAGTDHRKFMRMMPVMVRITAPLYWWKEFDTYKVGTVANSCSTMHKITEKEFTMLDFSEDKLMNDISHTDDVFDQNGHIITMPPNTLLGHTINHLNIYRKLYLETKDKKYWWQLIQLLPSSYNQTRNVMLNYEALYNIYHARKNHKLDEWREFCKWIETLEFSFLITGKDILKEGLEEGLLPGA